MKLNHLRPFLFFLTLTVLLNCRVITEKLPTTDLPRTRSRLHSPGCSSVESSGSIWPPILCSSSSVLLSPRHHFQLHPSVVCGPCPKRALPLLFSLLIFVSSISSVGIFQFPQCRLHRVVHLYRGLTLVGGLVVLSSASGAVMRCRFL